MAYDPKPITVEYVDPGDYSGAQDPQPFVVVGEAPGGGGVESVNGQTGAVTLSAEDVGALPDSYTPPAVSFSDITGTATAAQIPDLSVSKITSLQATLSDLESRVADLEAAAQA